MESSKLIKYLANMCWSRQGTTTTDINHLHAFIAQGLRVIIVVVQVGAMKIYVAAVEGLTEKERQDETQFTIKIGGKCSLSPNYFHFQRYVFDGLLCWNWLFSPPNHTTLQNTNLIHTSTNFGKDLR
jgi:hypothetical protein